MLAKKLDVKLNKEIELIKSSKSYKGNSDPLDILKPLEPKILNKKGKVNWLWVIANIFKLVARVLLAIRKNKS